MTESTIATHSTRELQAIFGIQDRWLREVCRVLPVQIFAQDATIHIRGQANDVRQATRILEQFRHSAMHHQHLTPEDVARVIESVCLDVPPHADGFLSIGDDTPTEEAASISTSHTSSHTTGHTPLDSSSFTVPPLSASPSSTPTLLSTSSPQSPSSPSLPSPAHTRPALPGQHNNSLDVLAVSATSAPMVSRVLTNPTAPMGENSPRWLAGNRERKDRLPPMRSSMIDVFTRRPIRPKTRGQAAYLDAVSKHDITFCVGPAGTGKTYLAVAMAVTYLKEERIRKIALVRPAVEAGENLGFLPGDLQAKINPYLRPLLDAIREMIDYDTLQRLTEQEVIEMVPLAYMRGRTLNEAFMILDEAQNTTVAQMKMFLTRMGSGSKVVVCGDVTQNDLPRNTVGGLPDALRRLRGIHGIALHTLDASDIVRHSLVQEIVRAYDAPEDELRSRSDTDSDHSANRNIL